MKSPIFKRLALFFTLAILLAMCLSAANQKPYTILIYMNGSDLESDFGAATADLVEMLDSGLDSRHANIVLLTGGANRWQNDVVPASECIIWEVADGWLYEIESMGLVNMGDPATLRDFIRYGMTHYPANRYGLIMWDHGGGSIAGFGHDEKFNDASLTLHDMKLAFEEAGLRDNKLEFLGFDACLMATIEMALIAADYAHVLIASEDLEPGDGWDYHFLGALNTKPQMDGFALGKIIVDSFIDFYGPDSDELLSLSVVDLSRVQPVMDTMGQLMVVASGQIGGTSFPELARRRGITKTFGEGSPRDNYSDMVDIGDMATQLMDLFPTQARAVHRALERCVVYNRHNSEVEIHGLSSFYIYGGKSEGEYSLRTYSDLEVDVAYTQYLHSFFGRLTNRAGQENHPPVHSELVLWLPIGQDTYRMAGLLQTDAFYDDIQWPRINGEPVTMFPAGAASHSRFYAIPAEANGRECDIIVVFNNRHLQGHIKGLRYLDGYVVQKGYDPIEPGDKIAIYSLEWDFARDTRERNWHKSDVFTVQESLHLSWEIAPVGHMYGHRHTDIWRNVSYTTPQEF